MQKSRLSWQKKAVFSVATLLGVGVMVEVALALLGVAPTPLAKDPYVGFEPSVPLFVRDGDRYVTNPVKLTFFNQQEFPLQKDADEVRIFCLGGSTTYGHPYDARACFGTSLEAYLSVADAKRQWRVVNCGGISYASYRIALLMEELIQYQPDVFVLYTGHNEFLEERTYGKLKRRAPWLRRLEQWAARTRTYALMDSFRPQPEPDNLLAAEANTMLDVVGPDAYERDRAWQQGVVSHFEFSLRRMVQLAREHDVELILVKPAANLADFSPFKSQPGGLSDDEKRRWEEAFQSGLAAFEDDRREAAQEALARAADLDPQHALTLWYTGRACLQTGENEAAMSWFVRSRDEDVCPLRAISPIEAMVESVATEESVHWIDYPELLTQRYGFPDSAGDRCFVDHVHPTIEAHDHLAYWILQDLARRWDFNSSLTETQRMAIQLEIQSRLSEEDRAQALNMLAMTLSWSGKDAEALKLIRQAYDMWPENSEIMGRFAGLLERMQRGDEALELYREAVRVNPRDSMVRARLGSFYGARGDYEAAREHLHLAVRLTPPQAPLAFRVLIRLQLGDALSALGENSEAQRWYREALELDPRSEEARARVNGRR